MEKHTTAISKVQGEGLWNNKVRATVKSTISPTASGIKPVQLRALLLNWIIADSLPFNLVKSEAFRAFLNYINHDANELIPLSLSIIRKDLTATI